jgi:DNA helicase-2/ATP-dependent DNA helicase PcrA
LRVINTPARGIGKTTIEQIEQFALANDLSLWNALRRMLEEQAFPARAEAALRAFERLIGELTDLVTSEPLDEILRQAIARSGYGRMLESDNDPESESRLANLNELVNAAAEAAERGETLTDFLDHAALVADSDDLDARAAVSLLTMHNAKGLEWPVVFIAGLEEGLFPHSRSLNSNAEMEEERRLCYVGMTRAQKRLILSWARYRRRFGGGQPEACVASRFLKEVPRERLLKLREDAAGGRYVDLFAERHEVRETVKKNLYTGKTYNSLDNIAQYFSERGIAAPRPAAPVTRPTAPVAQVPAARPIAPVAQAPRKKPLGPGASVNHPKYGHGMILRREGEGEDAKLTVSFPGYGLKKLIAKYAGFKLDE